MRLTKVQKKLKELGIEYNYIQKEATYILNETGEIDFKDLDGNRYTISEHTGSGKTVQGIMTNGKDFKGDYWTQGRIVNWLDNNYDRFVDR